MLVGTCSIESAPAVRLFVVKTRLNPMSELLKQLVLFTSATSSGSARVTSTHWVVC